MTSFWCLHQDTFASSFHYWLAIFNLMLDVKSSWTWKSCWIWLSVLFFSLFFKWIVYQMLSPLIDRYMVFAGSTSPVWIIKVIYFMSDLTSMVLLTLFYLFYIVTCWNQDTETSLYTKLFQKYIMLIMNLSYTYQLIYFVM